MASGRGPKVAFKWEGITELKNTLASAGVKLDDKDPEVKAAILEPAKAMIENARNLAPIAKEIEGKMAKKYPPGTLKRSLLATVGPKTQRGVFLVARKRVAYYAPWVEFGTSKMSPHPFFRPALMQFMSTYVNDIAPGIKRLVEGAVSAKAFHPPK
jgi:HK97 gp10 family phage protein